MMVEMMEDVHCSSGGQLDSVDNLLFCSVNSEPSIKRRSVVKCASMLRISSKNFVLLSQQLKLYLHVLYMGWTTFV